jgi:O-antigen ligase
MILIMPLEQTPWLTLADSFLVFQDLTVIKLLGLCGFGWALLRIAAGDAPPLFASRQARLFLVFFGGVVFSSLLSGSGFLVVSKYLAFLVFMTFVLVAVRDHDDLRRVVRMLPLALIIVFPYGLRLMYRYNTRLGMGLWESNYFAATVVATVPIAVAIALQQARPARRWLWLGGAALLGVEVVLTGSRGGFLGLLAATLTYVYRRRGLVAAAGVSALVIGAVIVVPTELSERALATLSENAEVPPGLEQSNRAHTALFWAALRMISDAPILGVGPLNFMSLSMLYTGLDREAMAHNSYLEIAAELGIPIFLVFLGVLATTFGTLTRASRLGGTPAARELAGWAEGLRAGLVGFCVAGAFISAEYEKILWIIVFLSIVVGRFAARYEREAVVAPEPAPLSPVPPVAWGSAP